MPQGWLAYHVVARHGYAIERLKRDMAKEASSEGLVDFLAYDAASFIWGFLLASGNAIDAKDRRLRDALQAAVLGVLAAHGIDPSTFVVRPQLDAGEPLAGAEKRRKSPKVIDP